MRERATATVFIWISQAVCIGLILNRLDDLMSSFVQIGLLVLMGILAIAAGGATVAIWQNAASAERREAALTEKAKRDNRDARVRRLLATMDDEELDLLEGGGMTSEEERLSLEALLKKRG
jgi:hypothetical protein